MAYTIADSLGGLQESRPTHGGLCSSLCHLLCDPEQLTAFLPASCFLHFRELNVSQAPLLAQTVQISQLGVFPIAALTSYHELSCLKLTS